MDTSMVSSTSRIHEVQLTDPDYPAGRLLRDSRLYTVGAGTQEIRRMLIGRGFNEQFAAVDGRAIAQ
jgi:alkylation response protein AidB-like acyl-CoA dehydrogenase